MCDVFQIVSADVRTDDWVRGLRMLSGPGYRLTKMDANVTKIFFTALLPMDRMVM
jgi:hypothetical protein